MMKAGMLADGKPIFSQFLSGREIDTVAFLALDILFEKYFLPSIFFFLISHSLIFHNKIILVEKDKTANSVSKLTG